MKNMMLITGLAVALGLSTNAAAQSTAAQQGAPTVKTGAAMKAKAASPAPSDTAKNKSKKTTVGKGNATAKASAPSSYWTEEVDLHDDGSVETTEFLYDAQRGIIYAYGEDDFTCANGKPEKAAILEAAYTTGNKAGKHSAQLKKGARMAAKLMQTATPRSVARLRSTTPPAR